MTASKHAAGGRLIVGCEKGDLGSRQHAGGPALRDKDAARRQLLGHHGLVEFLGVQLCPAVHT